MKLSMAALVGMGRKTVTNMLVTAGLQFQDWTAFYRLFSKERFAPDPVFAQVARQVHALLPPGKPFVAAIDDTPLRKTGKQVYGAKFRRDPMGPKFHTNFIWAQRFIQLAVALPLGEGAVGARTIPVDFCHAPLPRKPKKNAPEEECAIYEAQCKAACLSNVARERIEHLRNTLDQFAQGRERVLWLQGDGGYTNAAILKSLPERTIFTGRVRKDAKLYFSPSDNAMGRKRVYGEQAPSPEALRQAPEAPWQEIQAHAAGQIHTMRVKTLASLRSAMAGKTPLRLIVIEPLGYRLRKNSKILYRQPAYLICTDLERSLEEIVQAYVWRWEIEVNHRDEKSILGVGQAQVRGKAATARVPAFLVASYAMALLAALYVTEQQPLHEALPRPRWQQKGNPQRPAFQQIQHSMRTELWAKALGVESFSGFAPRPIKGVNPLKLEPSLASTVLATCK